jgi:hypothetical protein
VDHLIVGDDTAFGPSAIPTTPIAAEAPVIRFDKLREDGAKRLPRQQRNVWEYPWRHAVRELRMLWVQFSDDGVVREVVEMHDYENDPDNGKLP